MPFTCANPPTTIEPSGTMNTTLALDPDPGGNPNPVGDPDAAGNLDTGGDLAAAIALWAQTLATQNIPPPPTPESTRSHSAGNRTN